MASVTARSRIACSRRIRRGDGVPKTARDLTRDSAFGWHTWSWARLQSARGKGKAFFYYFDQHPPRTPGRPRPIRNPPRRRVPFVFENLEGSATAADRPSRRRWRVLDELREAGRSERPGPASMAGVHRRNPVVMHLRPNDRAGPVPSAESLKVLDESLRGGGRRRVRAEDRLSAPDVTGRTEDLSGQRFNGRRARGTGPARRALPSRPLSD